jgi:hypothetical protein
MVPTNEAAPTVGRSLVADAKLAIAAGDRVAALALLDGLRSATTDEGRQLAPAVAEALVATARGESLDDSDRQALRAVEQTRSALRQILEWLGSLPFDADDLADIDVAVAARRRDQEQAVRDDEARLAPGGTFGRALGAGWLEWRWVSKPSGRKHGPYVYFRWREAGRKRTKYVGKVVS